MADYRKALFSLRFQKGGLRYSLLAGETPCDLGIETDPDELKKLEFLKDAPVKPQFKYNVNKGIFWSVFKTYSDEYLYEPTCENFKEMPDEIWNTIFKKVYWNGINGDEIDNQGIANMLSYISLKSNGLLYLSGYLQKLLKEFGYTIKQPEGLNIMNMNLSKLDAQYTDAINDIEAKGKSSELYDRLFFDYERDIIPLEQRKEKETLINSFYLLNKPYASSLKEKSLFVGGVLGIVGGLIIISRM
jgi:hypothetical protein